jgi:hypothetical protein
MRERYIPSDEDIRLVRLLDRMLKAGVITDRQFNCLQGATTKTDAKRILHVLTRKR